MSLSFRFGTVGSPLATPRNPGGTVGGIRCAASLGLDALELGWVNGVRVGAATCALIRQASAETGVALSVHAPYYINLNGDDEKWPRLRKYLLDAAHFGNLAGATDIKGGQRNRIEVISCKWPQSGWFEYDDDREVG